MYVTVRKNVLFFLGVVRRVFWQHRTNVRRILLLQLEDYHLKRP
jgi:hypothetical protein